MRRGGRTRARGGTSPETAPPATVAWADLPEAERTALKRMNRGPYPALAPELGRRLVGLGLAVARPDGVGISRAGRALVIGALLDARRDDADTP